MSLLGIGTTIAGAAYNEYGNQRQNRQDRTNAMMQYQNQRKLNQQGNRLQMDMWNKTNYGAQVDHMKEAGLNPALMYGSAGQGGTTGSQGGGSATKAQAPKAPVMDMSNMLLDAQIKAMEAKANSDNANAEATRGYQAKESGARTTESGARTRGIEESINKTIAEVDNLSQAKKNMIASEKLTVTQNEKEEINRDIAKQNRKFYENNDLSEGDYGLIKALKRAGVDLYRAIQFVIYSTPEEAKEVIEFKKGLDQ